MTNTELKNNIDAAITNKTSASSITPVNVGEQIKSTVDYIDQEISNIELTPGPAGIQGEQGIQGIQGQGSIPKTSGAVTLNGTFQVLPFDINSCSFQGGKAFLPTTTENGKEILVIATANNIEIRANASGTNYMFQNFNTFVSSVTLLTNEMYKFTFVGFGGYWKAEKLETKPYKVYSALISQSGTGIPIAKVLENTTGVNFSYTINSTGNYMLTGSSNVFTANKTATICSFNSNGSFPNGTMFFYSIGSQFFIIETRNSGTLSDGIITDAFIEIRVYN